MFYIRYKCSGLFGLNGHVNDVNVIFGIILSSFMYK